MTCEKYTRFILIAHTNTKIKTTHHFSAMFSDVTPMGMRHDCASEDDATRGFMPPSHFIGLDVIVSTPAAMPTS